MNKNAFGFFLSHAATTQRFFPIQSCVRQLCRKHPKALFYCCITIVFPPGAT